jgi:mono/diheme cytochrome c family protein
MIWAAWLFWAQAAVPPQIQRGEALFLDTSQGCTSCHSLKGHGAKVGPDLSAIGKIGSRAIATAIHSTVTQYVQTVKLKSGETFPGMPVAQDESCLQFYDLSKMPPELRRIDRPDLVTTLSQDAWKHPPAVGNYTDQQIADLVAYIRYVATGKAIAVQPSDVE